MKNLILSLLTLAVTSFAVHAQESVSDEELKKYAIVMDSINSMKAILLNDIKDKVESNEKITNARYNELSKIINDEIKLKEANASEEEIAFLREVALFKTEGLAKITKTFHALEKDYGGSTAFNKTKKAITEDETIRSKYRSYMDELEKGASSAN